MIIVFWPKSTHNGCSFQFKYVNLEDLHKELQKLKLSLMIPQMHFTASLCDVIKLNTLLA